uniref:Uncharacterized protein n=1 Tax=Ixodes ricinus TaxID=34613 RepID=A0A0K8R3H3_IXORI
MTTSRTRRRNVQAMHGIYSASQVKPRLPAPATFSGGVHQVDCRHPAVSAERWEREDIRPRDAEQTLRIWCPRDRGGAEDVLPPGELGQPRAPLQRPAVGPCLLPLGRILVQSVTLRPSENGCLNNALLPLIWLFARLFEEL